MKVIEPGHIYELDTLDSGDDRIKETLIFVNRNEFKKHPGTNNQEVLRALIDRIEFMDRQIHWPLNAQIIHHLRMAIALHEARTIIRKAELGKINIEELPTGIDGHILINCNTKKDTKIIQSFIDEHHHINIEPEKIKPPETTIKHAIKDKELNRQLLDDRIVNVINRARTFLLAEGIECSFDELMSSGIKPHIIRIISASGRAAKYFSSSSFKLALAIQMMDNKNNSEFIVEQYRGLTCNNNKILTESSRSVLKLVKSGDLTSSDKYKQLAVAFRISDQQKKDIVVQNPSEITYTEERNSCRKLISILLDKITEPVHGISQ